MPEEVCVKSKGVNSKNRVTAHTTMLNDQIRIGASQLSSAHSRLDCQADFQVLTVVRIVPFAPAVSPDFFEDCVQYKLMLSVC